MGKAGARGIRLPRTGINQKGNLKKGLQPAQCVTTPKGCRTANSQECRYLEKIVSRTRAMSNFFYNGLLFSSKFRKLTLCVSSKTLSLLIANDFQLTLANVFYESIDAVYIDRVAAHSAKRPIWYSLTECSNRIGRTGPPAAIFDKSVSVEMTPRGAMQNEMLFASIYGVCGRDVHYIVEVLLSRGHSLNPLAPVGCLTLFPSARPVSDAFV